MPSNLLIIIAFVITFVASLFLLKSGLGLTNKLILKLSSINSDNTQEIIDSLLKQSCDTYVGALYLFFAFLTQILSLDSKIIIDKSEVTEFYIFASLGLGISLYVLGVLLSNMIFSIRKKKIRKLK